MNNEEISAVIEARIKSGELPSAVLRSVLEQHPSLIKSGFEHLLVEAFDDSVLIHFAWKWRASDKSDTNDTQFNVRVIGHLIQSGVLVPWDKKYCESELKRIEPKLQEEAIAKQKAALEAVSFENLVSKLCKQRGKVKCIQALWDGDTSGWFIWLSAFVKVDNELEQVNLGTIRFGTDIRLFNGKVPPWPEAEYAKDVGSKLAQEYNAEFYFPSPNEPDDDQPAWIDVYRSKSANSKKQSWWKIW
jgi:hypothetical protein